MPASAGSGLLFELCSDGIPAEFMQFLAGSEAHGHHDHDAGGHDNHQCPIGHLLTAAAAVDNHWAMAMATVDVVPAVVHTYSYNSAYRAIYHSRGPPA